MTLYFLINTIYHTVVFYNEMLLQSTISQMNMITFNQSGILLKCCHIVVSYIWWYHCVAWLKIITSRNDMTLFNKLDMSLHGVLMWITFDTIIYWSLNNAMSTVLLILCSNVKFISNTTSAVILRCTKQSHNGNYQRIMSQNDMNFYHCKNIIKQYFIIYYYALV